jgi:hypothetical protein
MEVTKASSAFPAKSLTNSALIFSVDDLLKTRDNVSVSMFSELNHEPSTTHLLGDGPCSAGPGKRIKDYITLFGGYMENSLD